MFCCLTTSTARALLCMADTEFRLQEGNQHSSLVVCWARLMQRRGFDPPTGENFSGKGDFSLGVNMGSDSILLKLVRMRV